MLVASIVAIVIFLLSRLCHSTCRYVKKEYPKDLNAIIFFRSSGRIFNVGFWMMLFLMGLITIIKLIWGG